MPLKKTKLFVKSESGRDMISAIPYDENDAFIKRKKSEGYRQVIITTDIMIKIIRMMCLEREFSICKIEFSDEDWEIEQEISLLIEKFQKDRVFFGDLIHKIGLLAAQSSISVAKVYFKGKPENGYEPNIFIQSNGILSINSESFEELTSAINTVVEQCLYAEAPEGASKHSKNKKYKKAFEEE